MSNDANDEVGIVLQEIVLDTIIMNSDYLMKTMYKRNE